MFMFFLVDVDFVVLTRTNRRNPSDNTWGLFAKNFRSLSSLKLLSPPREIIHFLVHLGHFETLVGEYLMKSPVYYLFYRTQVLWCQGHV